MKILQINTTCGVGSTGKICVGISQVLNEKNIENYIAYSCIGSDYPYGLACTDSKYIKLQALKSRVFGNYGFNSEKATKKLIAEIERIGPDIVHLHNIHGHDCNLEILFTYFRSKGTRLIWTFHDCWAFTAYCPHFTMAGCDKWESGCHDCVQRRSYSWFTDKSSELYERKKELFSGLDMTVVTPSEWLSDLVKRSFFKDYPVRVINNGIDLEIFRPCESDFAERHGLKGKKIILGVSFGWNESKGLDVFISLASRLPDSFRIVLVGTDEKTDKLLPDNIISVHRTQNQSELAEIYSAADVFANPTREENYPTVNMEALACGTPVVTFRTGGSPEIADGSCGSVVECDDIDAFEKELVRVCTEKPYSRQQCVKRAEAFDKNERFKEYSDLYEGIITAGAQGD